MTPYYQRGGAAIYQGDCLDVMRALPAGSVQCCVTSPPYYGLRDYGVDGQIGLEPTPDAYVARLVDVFGEVWRVLADDGTCWLNLGDSYATGAGRAYNPGGGDSSLPQLGVPTMQPNRMPLPGLKPKDLIGIPWRVAFALQSAGWYLRSDIIWSKPNPMPESVRDRPTKSHEYVFLLAKRERYWYDADAVSEPAVNGERFHGAYATPGIDRPDKSRNGRHLAGNVIATRNARTVWTITPKPYREAHFATMPVALAERCIKAGCPEGGVVLDPFTGAGTTAVAALGLGRRFVGAELNATYCGLAAKRIDGVIDSAPLLPVA